MPATTDVRTTPLDRLLKKVASVKSGNAKENVPSTSHVTGSIDDGTQKPTSGPTATEQKGNVADAAQANPIDGSKLAEGNGDKEHGLRRLTSDDKPQITPEKDSNDPMKLASLSTSDLIAKYSSLAVPAAAQLLVDAARGTTKAATLAGVPSPAAVGAPPSPAAVGAPAAPPAMPAPTAAAAAGAQNALKMARQLVAGTVAEAEHAADLLAHMTCVSIAKQAAAIKAAAEKKANDDAAAAAAAGGGLPPMPPPTGPGGGMPPGAEGGGGLPPELAGAAGGGGGMPPGAEGGAPGGDGKGLSEEQIQQLLMALVESQGNADPKALEESADPAAQAIGKQARAFMKQGKFQLRPAKDAKDRAAIDSMKTFLQETTR
jgi:hypothetical protein